MTVPIPMRSSAGPDYAGLGRRLVAGLVDGLASAVIVYSVPLLAILVVGSMDANSVDAAGVFALTAGWMLVASLAWSIHQWRGLARRGQSYGKKVAGVWVLDQETGAPVGFGRILLRNVVLSLASVLVVPLLVMAALMVNDPRKQGWHDRAAGTVVVLAPPATTSYASAARPVAEPVGQHQPLSSGEPSAPAPVSLATGYSTAPPPWVASAVPPPAPSPAPARVVPADPEPAKASFVAPPPGWEPAAPAAERTIAAPARSAVARQGPTVPVADARWRMRALEGGAVIEVHQNPVVVGRAPAAGEVAGASAVVIDDPNRSMSKTHAALVVRDGELFVEDLDSTNGVYLRAAGDELRLPTRTATPVAADAVVAFGDCAFTAERLA